MCGPGAFLETSAGRHGLRRRVAGRMAFYPVLTLITVWSIVSMGIVGWASGQSASPEDQSDSQAAVHADRGLQLAQAGNLPSAEAELKQAVELAPAEERFLASLGTVLAMEKKLDESTTTFKHALKLAPHDQIVRQYLAANLWQLHRYPEARQNLEILLKQTPNDPHALLLLGMVAENMHDYAVAARALSAVPTLVHEQPESIAAMARSYYHIGKPSEARSALNQLLTHPAGTRGVLLGAHIADEVQDYDTAEKLLLSIKPNFPDQSALGLEIAHVQYRAKRFSDCQRTLLDVMASDYASGQIYNLLGWCYQEQNLPQEATGALESAIKLEPAVEQNYIDLCNIQLAHSLLPAALRTANRAVAAFSQSPQILLLNGSIELKVSQFSDAVASYRRATELDPGSADARLGLAEAQLGAGMTDEAGKSFESGMKQFPKDARFPLQFALMLIKEAETSNPTAEARGEKLLKSALTLDPASPEANYQLGELALKQGDAAQALARLRSAANRSSKDSRIYFALAQTYRRLGRKDEASKAMEVYQKLKQEQEPQEPSAAGVPLRDASHD